MGSHCCLLLGEGIPGISLYLSLLQRNLFPVEMDQYLHVSCCCIAVSCHKNIMWQPTTKCLFSSGVSAIQMIWVGLDPGWVCSGLCGLRWVSSVALLVLGARAHMSGSRLTAGWSGMACLCSAPRDSASSSYLAQARSHGRGRNKRSKLKCSNPFSSLWLLPVRLISH